MITTKRIRQIAATIAIILTAAAIAGAFIKPRVIEIKAAKSPIDEIVEVAKAKGIKPEHLLAISAQESSMGKFLSGDNGCSKGWFQINTCPGANPAASGIIGNTAKEAVWVADKLISYGYLEGNITLSFARYNSPVKPNFAYAELVKKRLLELDKFLEPYQTP
jgi:hypothetical protein